MIASRDLLSCFTIGLLKVISAFDPDVTGIEEDVRRPIWNVAHMVNALYQADYYLDQGANSLEFDVSFDWEGEAKYTFHGIPCDCFRSCVRYENFITYLDYMRMLTTPGSMHFREELVLLFMDLKVHGLSPDAKVRAGKDIALKLLDHYWERGSSGARAYILISVPSVDQMGFVNSLTKTLKEENFTHYLEKIGFDVSGNENLDSIHSAYKTANIDDHIWQGDGITNCLPRGTGRLIDALTRRDQPGVSYIDKVYWWTVDRMSTMRTTLRMGIDGMITNYPDRLISILKEEEFSNKFRLATYIDNPWIRHTSSMVGSIQQAHNENSTAYDLKEEILYNC